MSEDISSYPSVLLKDQMSCGLLASPNGDIMIVHDKTLPSSLEWIEYHKDDGKLNLIDEDGNLIDLGIAIDDAMSKNLSHGLEVILAQLNGTQIIATKKVSIVIQDY